jgi:hypothetical protein
MKYSFALLAIVAMLALGQKPAHAQIVASVSLQTANCVSSNDTLLYVIQGITLNSQTVIVQLAQGSSTGVVVAAPPAGEFVVETINVSATPHTNYTYFLLEGVPSGVTTINTPFPYTSVSTTTKNCS